MIYTIGETVLDIIFENFDNAKLKPGGSMLNTAVSLGRLGLPVSHISITANDKLSGLLIDFLNHNQVFTDFLYRSDDVKTNLALAYLDEHKNASYTFYKDHLPNQHVLNFPTCTKNDLILFGSFFCLNKHLHSHLNQFLLEAKKNGAFIIYDPNFRKPFLPQLQELLPRIENNLKVATLVKGSNEDFNHIFNVNQAKSTWKLLKKYPIKGLCYTKGAGGAEFINNLQHLSEKALPINVVSTVGAGDTFSAGIIYFLYKNLESFGAFPEFSNLNWKQGLLQALKFAAEACKSSDNYISNHFAKQQKHVR